MQYSDDSAEPGQEPEYEGFELKRYHEMWAEAVDDYADARTQHYRDEDYYDGDVKGTGEGHWTTDELEILKGRSQPPSVFNLVRRKVNAIAGVEQRSRSEPRALPRTPKDQKSAEIVTDALRFIKDKTRWSNIKADASLEGIKIGYGAVEIGGAEDHVPITPIDWKDFFFDPRSRRPDFSDARYLGVAKWMDKDVALSIYVPPEPEEPPPLPAPELPPQPQDPAGAMQWAALAQQIIARYEHEVEAQRAAYEREVERRNEIIRIIESTAEGDGSSGKLDTKQFEDRPSDVFCDRKRRRIFVIDMWHKDPKRGWYRCVFTGAGKLFTEEASLIEQDQWGRKIKTHPIVAFSLFVSKDLWRYGEVRGMRSPQDEVNMRRSKALHLLTVRQLINRTGNHSAAEEGGREALRREAAKSDGYLEVPDPTQLRIENNMELAAGQQQLGEEARAFMEMEGPNPQLQGEQGRATSGRAVLALQQAGLGQLGPIFDRLHDWELRCYRAMWARVQQFWTAPMYVRVTDDKNAAKFAAVNGAPVVHAENGNQQGMATHQMPGGQMMPGAQHPMGGMGRQMPPQDPRMMMGANGGPPLTPEDMGETGPMLAELDMDIIIDRAPEAATLQAEQFEELAKLAQGGIFNAMPPAEVARFMITASALPNKSELLDKLDQMAQQPQQPNPAQMAELKKLLAQVEEIIAKTQKTKAETAQIGVEIPKTQVETAKLDAEARTANVDATMNEFGASRALEMGASMRMGGWPNSIDPLVAAAPTGAIGLPPIPG